MRVLNDADSETAELILRLHLGDIEAAEADRDSESESERETENTTDSDDASDTDTNDEPINPEDLIVDDLDHLHLIDASSAAPSSTSESHSIDGEREDEESDDDGSVDTDQEEPTNDNVDVSSNYDALNNRSIRAIIVDGDLLVYQRHAPELSSDSAGSRLEDEESSDNDGHWETEDDDLEHDDADLESDSEKEITEEDELESNESSSESEELSDNVSETSSHADYAGRSRVEEHPCIICGEMCCKNGSCLLSCGHYHCGGCLNHAFRLALKDRSAYPPRCCGTDSIPFSQTRQILDSKLADAFENKQEELDDPNPTYCFKSSCSGYIPESFKDGTRGMCKECFNETCILCRQQWHSGDCRNDEQIEQTLRLAKDMDWRKCPGCQRIVELTFGCNHVT
jgi:hypothetical protein